MRHLKKQNLCFFRAFYEVFCRWKNVKKLIWLSQRNGFFVGLFSTFFLAQYLVTKHIINVKFMILPCNFSTYVVWRKTKNKNVWRHFYFFRQMKIINKAIDIVDDTKIKIFVEKVRGKNIFFAKINFCKYISVKYIYKPLAAGTPAVTIFFIFLSIPTRKRHTSYEKNNFIYTWCI